MLHLLTKLLRDFLARAGVVPADRIFVDPPNADFLGKLKSLPPGRAVNVYLADLRENRKLRTAERRTVLADPNDPDNLDGKKRPPRGFIREELYPAWVDAHYLISAWDSSTNPSDREKPIREQRLLEAVSAALLAGDSLSPAEVYAPPTEAERAAIAAVLGAVAADAAADALAVSRLAQLDAWAEEFRVPPGLPFDVLPPDGFSKLSEFWTTMGQGTAWRPVVYLVASVPVVLAPSFDYPLVTTMTTVSGQTAAARSRRLIPGTERPWHQIGGQVTGPVSEWDRDAGRWRTVIRPLSNARVVLQIPAAPAADPPRPAIPVQETRTDDLGRFRLLFAGRPGAARYETNYQIAVSYPDLVADPVPVDLNPVAPFAHDVRLRTP
jgi:hypothetical protein